MSKKKPRIAGTRRQPNSAQARERMLSALHEAGHAIVAHALGRHVVYLRSVPRVVPVGHRDNHTDAPFVSMGFHLAEPLLAEEVGAQHDAGLPFTAAQREWLLQGCVIDWGGVIAQANESSQEAAMRDGARDVEMFGHAAGMLGQVVDRGDGTLVVEQAFQRAAERAARTILVDLVDRLVTLAEILELSPELEGEALEGALAGSPRGSHAAALDELRALIAATEEART